MRLDFFDDPAAFLAVAGDHLAKDPVLSTVLATVTGRAAESVDPPRAGGPRWWLAVRDGDEVVGAAMRTAPVPPHAMYVLPMPEPAAVELARVLHERGEVAPAINGMLPAAARVAEETARLTGGTVREVEHTFLYELEELRPGAPVPGRLRAATPDDLELVVEWYAAFEEDAAEQAGRPEAHRTPEPQDADSVRPRIEQGLVWLWEDESGNAVSVTAHNAPAYGVVRVGPVFTPKDQRGRGYGRAGVAAVSRRLLDHGHRVCLFADVDNPVSTGLYTSLGYRPRVEQTGLVLSIPGVPG